MVEALPLPPATLSLPAATRTIPAGTVVSRIFFAGGAYPTQWNRFRHFGPTRSRFDHHELDDTGNPATQARGIMYLAMGAQQFPVALAEVFQTTRVIDRSLHLPTYAGFALASDLVLLDLTGVFATAVGATMAIHSGLRETARAWSRLFYDTYPAIDGLLYCSSTHSHQPMIALYERAQRTFPPNPGFHRGLSDMALLNALIATAEDIGYQVV